MAVSTSSAHLGSYTVNTFLFSDEKKIQYSLDYLLVQLIPHIKSAYHYIAVGVKRHLCLCKEDSEC